MSLTALEVNIANQSLGKIGAKQMSFDDQTTVQGVQCNLYYDQTRTSLLRSFEWQFATKSLELVSSWETDKTYTTDQYVWQGSLLYKCAVAHTADTFATDLTSSYWSLQSTVSDWATATDYILGDFVVNDAVYYECISAHTSGDEDDEPGTGDDYATYWSVRTTKPSNHFGYSYDLPSSCIRLISVIDGEDFTWRLETNTIVTDETEVDIIYVDDIDDTTEWDPMFEELLIAVLSKKLLAPLSGSGSGVSSLREDINVEVLRLIKRINVVNKQEARGNTKRTSWNEARY